MRHSPQAGGAACDRHHGFHEMRWGTSTGQAVGYLLEANPAAQHWKRKAQRLARDLTYRSCHPHITLAWKWPAQRLARDLAHCSCHLRITLACLINKSMIHCTTFPFTHNPHSVNTHLFPSALIKLTTCSSLSLSLSLSLSWNLIQHIYLCIKLWVITKTELKGLLFQTFQHVPNSQEGQTDCFHWLHFFFEEVKLLWPCMCITGTESGFAFSLCWVILENTVTLYIKAAAYVQFFNFLARLLFSAAFNYPRAA